MQGAQAATRRLYCRPCGGPAPQRWAGWATGGGHENTVRPRAYYLACATCTATRLVLGNVNDAEGLCRDVLDRWLRGHATTARAGATGRARGDGALDAEDALAFLQVTIWELYLEWEPERGIDSFMSYAAGLLPKRLVNWSIFANGEASGRSKGRVYPKAHAASVSVSYDQLAGAEPGGAGAADGGLGGSIADFAPDRAFDLLRVLAEGDGAAARLTGGRGDPAGPAAPQEARG